LIVAVVSDRCVDRYMAWDVVKYAEKNNFLIVQLVNPGNAQCCFGMFKFTHRLELASKEDILLLSARPIQTG